ncbi:EamA family transporter [Acuticoccus sp. M5D2P5]|uniref:DMT family transporter n=1 Tax=Acuticoccus kalidii TaxID=2910977 RepID=UPI001F3ADC61|nr:EamA family transporter [Acuticoccus kalidii]MCF3933528.1 EamA family transporter [Acuticoccus kalidii]
MANRTETGANAVDGRPMTRTEWAMLIGLAAIWGGSFFFNAVGLTALPVLSLVAARVAIAAVVLLALMRLTGRRLPRRPAILGAFLAMALLNNVVPFSLIVAGQREIASGVAAILNASTPLFTVLFAHLLTADEKMSPNRIAGVLLGLSGVAVMMGIGAFGGAVTAQLLCLSAAISYALAGIYGRRFARMGVAPLATAAGQLSASSLVLVPLALLVDRPWTLPTPSLAAVAAILGLATVSTALAYVLYFRILSTAGATNLLLVTILSPVSAILLGVLVLGETLLAQHLAGMALVAAGLAAIDGRPLKALSRRLRSGSPGRESPSR